MKNNLDIEKKIADALNSIDEVEKASIPPYFFTRLEARMQKGQTFWEKATIFLTKPVIAFGSICVILFLNIYVISSATGDGMNMAQQSTEFASVDEYSQLSSNVFEFENFKP